MLAVERPHTKALSTTEACYKIPEKQMMVVGIYL
jgi:hypothetical protein